MVRLWTYPFRAVDRVLDHLAAVVGAIGFSQIPGFIDHYVQRLGGHAAEAQCNVASWQRIADASAQGDLHALITLYRASERLEVLEAGRKCAADVLRLEDLRTALDAIVSSPPWLRAIAFLRHMDADIARGALDGFALNVPLDMEGLCYAGIGLVLGVCVYAGFRQGVRAMVRAACDRQGRRGTAVPVDAGADDVRIRTR